MNIRLLPERFDISGVCAELAEQPQAWGEYRWRTESPHSPHREAQDIWVRYNAIGNFGPCFNDPHESVWYPIAEKLPHTRSLSLQVAAAMGAHRVGGVLLTKIPAHSQIYPHVDRGWHATYYEKIAVQIQGNPEQFFCFDDAMLSALPGQSYEFNNQAPHWVTNDSDEDRITLICCIRRVH
jgi:hypothetical protein